MKAHCCKSICSPGSIPYCSGLDFLSPISQLIPIKLRIGPSHPKSEASYGYGKTWYVLQE